MDAVTEKQELELEALIDSHGLSAIVDAVARVCVLKAEHVETNWQDESLAKLWRKAARRISQTAMLYELTDL